MRLTQKKVLNLIGAAMAFVFMVVMTAAFVAATYMVFTFERPNPIPCFVIGLAVGIACWVFDFLPKE